MNTLKTSHHNNLDFIRLMLALLVLVTHSYAIYYAHVDSEPLMLWANKSNRATLGNVAVNFFFLISGYLVIQSWFRSKNAIDYFIKRSLRIYPAFALVCFITAILFVPLGNPEFSNSIKSYFGYLKIVDFNYLPQTIIRLQPPYLPPTLLTVPIPELINFSLWTIPFEFFCYMLLLVFGVLKMARNKWIVFSFTILCIVNMFYTKYGDISWLNHFFKQEVIEGIKVGSVMVPFFMVGASWYHFQNIIPRKTSIAIACLVVTILSARFTHDFFFFQLIFGSYSLFCLAFSQKIRLSRLTRYGDFSYGVYLFGCPIQQLVMYYFGTTLSVFGTLAVALPIVILFAVFSWYVIEKPFLNLKKINSIFGIKFARSGVHIH